MTKFEKRDERRDEPDDCTPSMCATCPLWFDCDYYEDDELCWKVSGRHSEPWGDSLCVSDDEAEALKDMNRQ